MKTESTAYETKRFLPSPESREVLHGVREGFNHLKENNPEIIGMTVFGSMVKGTDTPESDVDGFIFLDKEKVTLDEEDIKWAKEDKGKHLSEFDKAVVNHYTDNIRKTFIENGLSQTHVEGLRVRSIDITEIENILQSAVEQKAVYLEKVNKRKEYIDSLGTSNEKEYAEYPDYEEDAKIPWKIPAMFHLQIGHDLDKYRKSVISTLEDAGDIGEILWGEIISHTSDLERNMSGYRYDHLFPTTIEEAKKYYKIENPA